MTLATGLRGRPVEEDDENDGGVFGRYQISSSSLSSLFLLLNFFSAKIVEALELATGRRGRPVEEGNEDERRKNTMGTTVVFPIGIIYVLLLALLLFRINLGGGGIGDLWRRTTRTIAGRRRQKRWRCFQSISDSFFFFFLLLICFFFA